MRRVVLAEPFRLEMGEEAVPVPQVREALLRVRRLGICGTDLHAYEGRQPYFSYPRVLGHEISAEIVGIGENAESRWKDWWASLATG
jgi:threonine dehydrogenase-like Zn-dependent dehydrogenase